MKQGGIILKFTAIFISIIFASLSQVAAEEIDISNAILDMPSGFCIYKGETNEFITLETIFYSLNGAIVIPYTVYSKSDCPIYDPTEDMLLLKLDDNYDDYIIGYRVFSFSEESTTPAAGIAWNDSSISTVIEGSSADEAGFTEGDRILKLVSNTESEITFLMYNNGTPIERTIEKKDRELSSFLGYNTSSGDTISYEQNYIRLEPDPTKESSFISESYIVLLFSKNNEIFYFFSPGFYK